MKSIIKEKVAKGYVSTFDKRIDVEIKRLSAPKTPKTVRYKNKETGETYRALAAGFGWPGKRHGFCIIVAVLEKPNQEAPQFKILHELEEKNITELIAQSYELWQLYGRKCTKIPLSFYGEQIHTYNKFIEQFNENLRHTGHKHFFNLRTPYIYKADTMEPDAFRFFCDKILSLAANKRIFIPATCDRLRGYMSVFDNIEIHKVQAKDYPAIFALGAVVYALDSYKPWIDRTGPQTATKPTEFEEYIAYHTERENRMFGIGEEDEEMFDDGERERGMFNEMETIG
uniref:Uncharacterized protein n=1 Tax=viral metagenome TaxID=1070528 RepID=A0A6M3XRT8_9ZZZZ